MTLGLQERSTTKVLSGVEKMDQVQKNDHQSTTTYNQQPLDQQKCPTTKIWSVIK